MRKTTCLRFLLSGWLPTSDLPSTTSSLAVLPEDRDTTRLASHRHMQAPFGKVSGKSTGSIGNIRVGGVDFPLPVNGKTNAFDLPAEIIHIGLGGK